MHLARAIPYDHSGVRHSFVDGAGVVNGEHQEVGVTGQHAVHKDQRLQRRSQLLFLCVQLVDLGLHDVEVLEGLESDRRSEFVDVVRCFDLVHHRDQLWRPHCETAADARQPEGLGHGLQDDKIGIIATCHKVAARRARWGKVDVGLINDDNSVIRVQQRHDRSLVDKLARRIPGRADENYLGLRGDRRIDFLQRNIHCRCEWYRLHCQVIRRGGDGVHAVRRWTNDDGVRTGHTEDSHEHVDSFVTTHADKDIRPCDPAVRGDGFFQGLLVGAGVALVDQVIGGDRRAEGVFVRIEQNSLGVVVAGAVVGLQRPNIRAYECL